MEICCLEWDEACKPPTGRTTMAVSYVSDDKAYAVALQDYFTDYGEDAWSVSFDDGDTWNQLSLIDTYIDYISDVAVSPDCNKTMLVTVNEDDFDDNGESHYYIPDPDTFFDPWECGILIPVFNMVDYYDILWVYCDSVWVHADEFPEAGYSEYSGHWLRTWSGKLLGYNGDDFPYVAERGLLRLAPEETTGDTVYLVDRMSDTIYWNELETLACWKVRSSAAGGIDEIADLAVADEATIYALDIDGGVAMSDDHGASLTWTDSVDSEVEDGWTIAVHSNDVVEILVGGQAGDVGYSDDGGETFTALDDVYTSSNVYVVVAFDTYYDQNDTIYAGLAHAYDNGGIYLWVIGGEPEEWHKLAAEPHDYTGIVLDRPGPANPYTSAATGGVLYASYFDWDEGDNCDYCGCEEIGEVGDVCWHSGVARCLTPITELCCGVGEAEWDYLTWGLETDDDDYVSFVMAPHALKICGCLTADSNSRLFAIDADDYDICEGQDGAVWTFEDCYAKKAVEPTSPADGFVVAADACECCNAPFAIEWDRLCDACCYEIQFARDDDFTDIVPVTGVIDGDGPYYNYFDCFCPLAPTTPSAWIGCYFDPGITYYWRIRASQAETCQEIHSWWSEAQSFTVSPTAGAAAIELVAPAPGALNVPPKNLGFSWDLLATADAFDWVLSKNADLSAPVQSKTGLTGTATTYSGTLDYGTTYYWQVTAYNDGAAISASAVGTFTTAATGAFCSAIDGMCFATQAELEAHNSEVSGKAAPTPFWVWVVIAIGAVLVIVVIVLIFRTRRV
jgi:hypothetical protein